MTYAPRFPEMAYRTQHRSNNLVRAAMVLKIGGMIVKVNRKRWVLVHRRGDMFAMIVMNPQASEIVAGGRYIHSHEHATMLLEKIIRDEGFGKYQIIKQ